MAKRRDRSAAERTTPHDKLRIKFPSTHMQSEPLVPWRWRDRRRSRGSIRHITDLVAGTAASQLILFLAAIPLARLFSPAEFGVFSVGLSIATLLSVPATMRYEAAIPLAGTEEDANAIASLAILCAVALSLSLAFIVSWVHFAGGPTWGQGSAILLIPPSVFALASWSVFKSVQARRGNFALISKAGVTSSATQSLIQVAAGMVGLGGVGLLVGWTIARATNAYGLLRKSGFRLSQQATDYRSMAKTWCRFPLMAVTPALLSLLSIGAVAPLIASLNGIVFAGVFAFAARVIGAPAAFLGQAVASVFYPRAAAVDRRGGSLIQPVHAATTVLSLIAIPGFGSVLLLGPQLFELLFGSTWKQAGVVAAVLSPWLAANFVSSPTSGLATVRNRLGRLFAMSVLEAVFRLGLLTVGSLWGGALIGVSLYSFAGVVISLAFLAWTLRLAGSRLSLWATDVRSYLSCALCLLCLPLLVEPFVASPVYVCVSLSSILVLSLWSAVRLQREFLRLQA